MLVVALLPLAVAAVASSTPAEAAPVEHTISTLLGRGRIDFMGRMIPDTSVLDRPASVSTMPSGDVLFTEKDRAVVKRRRAADGGVEVVAGGGTAGFPGDGLPATEAQLKLPTGAVADAQGNIFIGDLNRIRRVDATSGIISTFHLSSSSSFYVTHLSITADGTLYVTSSGRIVTDWYKLTTVLYGAQVHRISPSGVLTTLAGTSANDVCQIFCSNSCALITGQQLCSPRSAVADDAGNLFVSDANRVLRYPAGGGPRSLLTTLGGSGARLALGPDGALYAASTDHRVHRIDRTTGATELIAGTGVAGYNGDDRLATTAQLNEPQGIAVDGSGGIVIADLANHRIRRVGPRGAPASLAGTISSPGLSLSGVVVSLYRTFPFWEKVGEARVGPDGRYRIDGVFAGPHRVRIVDPWQRTQRIWVDAAVIQSRAATVQLQAGETTALDVALQPRPTGAIAGVVTADLDAHPLGDVWVQVLLPAGFVASARTGADGRFTIGGLAPGSYRIRLVDLGGTHRSEWYEDATAFVTSAPIDVGTATVEVTPHLGPATLADIKVVRTVAGEGDTGFAGDGGPATQARFSAPQSVRAGPDGSLYIADTNNKRIRRIDPNGTIETVAGNGSDVLSGDGGPATAAGIGLPMAVAVDTVGNLFILDRADHLRRVDAGTHVITTIAGGGTAASFEAPATEFQFGNTVGMTLGPDGWLYISDIARDSVVRIEPTTLDIEPVLTSPTGAWNEHVPDLVDPGPLGFGPDGALYISGSIGSGGGYIARWDPDSDERTIVAGVTGNFQDDDPDGIPATAAHLRSRVPFALDDAGNIYLSEGTDRRIRMVERATGVIFHVAGDGTAGFDPATTPALETHLCQPSDSTWHAGRLYFLDYSCESVRSYEGSG